MKKKHLVIMFLKGESSALSLEEVEVKKRLNTEYWRLSRASESLIRQKSRVLWINEGDSNSRYFHSYVNFRRRFNSIHGLYVHGQWVDDPEGVKGEVRSFFETKFRAVRRENPMLDGVAFNQLSLEEKNLLCAGFDMEELREAV